MGQVMRNMKVYKAKSFGFCFGVKRALEIAKKTVVSKKAKVYIIGDIVHNEKVCKDIQRQGIKKVKSIEEIPQNSYLIIKAHGVPKDVYEKARINKIKIVDATCPQVLEIHKIANNLIAKGYQIIIAGDKQHEETLGILGNIKEGLVIETPRDLKYLKNRLKKKVALVCQSTQDLENVANIVKGLVESEKELLFINTICWETEKRQKEIKSLAKKCKSVLVVGSKKSANSRRLYNIAKRLNKNTFFIQDESQLSKKIKSFSSIALIGGASTPPSSIEKISEKLNRNLD